MRSLLLLLVVLPVTASAQTGHGSVRCYLTALDDGFERLEALRLCTGARTDAPARCAAAAVDQLGYVEGNAVGLCRLADSLAPVSCAEELQARTTLDEPSIVRSCSAGGRVAVPATGPAGAACVEAALDDPTLPQNRAVRLCRGATTLDPVTCYELATDEGVPARVAVDLCAPTAVVSYAPPVYLR